MRRLSVRNARRGRSHCSAAVDPKADQRQPTRAELPSLKLLDEIGDQPLESLHRSFRVRRRLFQLEQGARRAGSGYGGQRLRLAAKRAVERVDRIVRIAETAGKRAALNSSQHADGLQPQPL